MKNTLIIILFLQFVNLGFAQNSDMMNNKLSIDSDILKETREVWIGLPINYDSTLSYPTIYVLDAEDQFDITYAIMKELAVNDKIPNHIVIGIPYVSPQKRVYDLSFTTNSFNSDGTPDSLIATYFSESLTGGGRKFLNYLSNEVNPLVNSKYATNGFDIFIGHSLSGYFGANILTLESPFEAFELYDPSIWYNNAEPIKHFTKTVDKGVRTNVFISSANSGNERQQYNIDTHAEFHNLLLQNNINSELKVYEEGHGSVRLPSLIDGLTNLYNGYSIGTIMPTDTITAQDVRNHYLEFSNKVNFNFTPPVEAFRWTGYVNYVQGKWKNAIEAYQECSTLFNQDVMMLTEFADCFFQMKQYKESLKIYEMALLLAPENEDIKSRIEDIKLLTTKNKQH